MERRSETADSENFATGYWDCSLGANQSVVVAIGTNNGAPSGWTTAQSTAHGTQWADMVNRANDVMMQFEWNSGIDA